MSGAPVIGLQAIGLHIGNTAVLSAGEDSNKAGPIGLLVLVVLGIACYWLFRSMSKHLRRVPTSFTEPAPDGRAAPSAAASPPVRAGEPVVDGTALDGDPVERPAP